MQRVAAYANMSVQYLVVGEAGVGITAVVVRSNACNWWWNLAHFQVAETVEELRVSNHCTQIVESSVPQRSHLITTRHNIQVHLRLLVCKRFLFHWHSARWAWNGYQPGLSSIPRPGKINCFRITGVHALKLISRTGKRVWRCPL